MAKNDGTPREVKPQQPECDGLQFARNPYAQDESAYYDVRFDQYNNVIPESREFTPDGPFYQSGGSDPAYGESQFRNQFSASDGERLSKQIAEGEIRPHANDFADKRSTTFVDVGRANRGSDDGYDPNQPSPERNRTHMDFSRGGKR